MSQLGLGEKFPFENLVIFEMANNHQGDVAHGKRIIAEMGKLAAEHGVRAAIKFQFRDLDTFVHPAHKNGSDNKHVPRFFSTRLSDDQFAELVAEVRAQGLVAMATPFDEKSVDLIERLNLDIVKVASCSATDWPLLERAAETGKPVICSTAGLEIPEVDRLVSFFQHRGIHFALMHCVGMYPTPPEKMDLTRIAVFKNRYPGVVVGYSTHEDPNDIVSLGMAYAQGARIFEKHVGVPTETIKLNAYSASPEQAAGWIKSFKLAGAAIRNDLPPRDAEEVRQLKALTRGVFAKRLIRAGETITRGDIYFAFPFAEGGIASGEFKHGVVADRDYRQDEPLGAAVKSSDDKKRRAIYDAIHAVKGMLAEAKIPVGLEFNIELSHHYGLDNFHKIGVAIIDCINREYCKKILVQLPGQRHPSHYHKKKEETFQLLSGRLEIEMEGRRKTLYPGDIAVVPRGAWHYFWTETGAIFEEVSTTHFNDDSFYEDREIAKMPREARKTKLINWGRHQFEEKN
jgi:N-acetylneuraminate synthase